MAIISKPSPQSANAAVSSDNPLNRVPLRDYDRLFIIFILVSLLIHGLFVSAVHRIDTSKIKPKTIEEVPMRIARLLMDKPKKPEKKIIEKTKSTAKTAEGAKSTEAAAPAQGSGGSGAPVTAERRAAQVRVAKQATRIERELRSTGMLALLTGVGPSKFRGRAAVDVLGGAGGVRGVDLDAALKGVTGVSRAGSEADMAVKLTTRRVVESEKQVSISDMVKGFGSVNKQLDKLGEIQVSKPKTVGTAPQSTNRDESVISGIVKKGMTSITNAYNRLLKSNPGMSGKITVRFTIMPDGSVTDVEIVDASLADDGLQQKIIQVVSNWRFPPIGDSEGNLTVNYPFIFQPN